MAAAINPADYKMPKMIGGLVAGLDAAGVIEAVGKDVTAFKVGDEVYGNGFGCLGQYAELEEAKVALKPAALTFEQAAAVPTAYLTALQALRDHGRMQQGHTVLVIGASGGCGIAGLQVARALGASAVVGVCSGKNEAFARSHGATQIVDYNKETFVDVFEKGHFDLVFDCASGSGGGGEDYHADSLKVLKSTGHYVYLNGSPMHWLKSFTGLSASNMKLFLTKHSRVDLDTLRDMIEATPADGAPPVAPVIDLQLPWNAEAVDEGFERLKSRRTKGKVVFSIDGHEAAPDAN